MTYEAPTDWTIHILYNVGMASGKISIKSRVVHYGDEDLDNLNTIWEPTGTTYVSTEERVRLAAEKEERARIANEELNNIL